MQGGPTPIHRVYRVVLYQTKVVAGILRQIVVMSVYSLKVNTNMVPQFRNRSLDLYEDVGGSGARLVRQFHSVLASRIAIPTCTLRIRWIKR